VRNLHPQTQNGTPDTKQCLAIAHRRSRFEGAISGNGRGGRNAGEVQVVEPVLWDHTLEDEKVALLLLRRYPGHVSVRAYSHCRLHRPGKDSPLESPRAMHGGNVIYLTANTAEPFRD
jgi:hypothetical protein